MPYDPALPANNAPIVSAELRNQFAGLKALIDAQAVLIADLQSRMATRATNPGMSPLNIAFDDPPTQAQLQDFQFYINDLVTALQDV